MPSERQFQRWFLDSLKHAGVWAENVHPTAGMKTGIPDVFVLSDSGLVPIELKVGKIEGDALIPKEIRPAQIRWAKKFQRSGGVSALVTGVHDGKGWEFYYIPNVFWLNGDKKFDTEYCPKYTNPASFVSRLGSRHPFFFQRNER